MKIYFFEKLLQISLKKEIKKFAQNLFQTRNSDTFHAIRFPQLCLYKI